jgi:uncharacterized protein YjiS (DUF1127 family)
MSKTLQAARAGTAPRVPRGRTRGPLEILTALVDLLLDWQDRAGQRRALAWLDERMLRDVGLTRADVEAEYAKPFWRP